MDTAQKTTFYTVNELELLDKTNIPNHIAIVPDGNRRWAKTHAHEHTPAFGYLSGANTLLNIVKAAKELGVKILTVYSFSTENWKRPKNEIAALMHLIETYLFDYQQQLLDSSIRVTSIGILDPLPTSLQLVLEITKEKTRNCNEFDLVFALNYGGRDELCRAFQKIAQECVAGKLTPSDITESLIAKHLDTALWPDPDLIIRSSGEKRLSNFLLWQSAYSELYIEPVMWPQFTPKHLLNAVLAYQQRDRRLGGDGQ